MAHLPELCMLDYPHRFGASLGDEVRRFGERWAERAWERVGHLYPRVGADGAGQLGLGSNGARPNLSEGLPVAYLWTRTVRCSYGLSRFNDLFTPRQLATLCAFAKAWARLTRRCVLRAWSSAGEGGSRMFGGLR